MLFNEYLALNNLWGTINSKVPFTFIADKGVSSLNTIQNFKYGSRTMLDSASTLDVSDLADLIIAEFSDKWLSLLTITHGSINAGRTEKITETVTNAETRVNTRDDVNKVSAFNSDTLIDNDGLASNANEAIDGEKGRILTKEFSDFSEAYKNLDLLEKNAIIQTVTRDVSNLLTLSIY